VETAPGLDEAQLVRALRDGEEAAFVEPARMYHSAMLRVAQIYVASRAVAEIELLEPVAASTTEGEKGVRDEAQSGPRSGR
jgi:hypothetical protein